MAEPTIQKFTTKAEMFENIKFQLYEMKGLAKNGTLQGTEQEKRLEKLTELISNLEELDIKPKITNDSQSDSEKLEQIEKETYLKAQMEQLKAKIELKEIENQQISEDLQKFKAKISELAKSNTEKFLEIRNRIIDCLKNRENDTSDENRSKLEVLVYRINYFLQNENQTIKPKNTNETSTPENEQKLIERLSKKYEKELDKLSLSQRERVVFNYIHQNPVHDELNDVCLDDLLKISAKDEENNGFSNDRHKRRKQLKRIIEGLKGPDDPQNYRNNNSIKRKNPIQISKIKREEYEKLERLAKCKSVIEFIKNNEFEESENSENDEGQIDIDEQASNSILLNDENKNERETRTPSQKVIVISRDSSVSSSNNDDPDAEKIKKNPEVNNLLEKMNESGRKENIIEEEIIESDTIPQNKMIENVRKMPKSEEKSLKRQINVTPEMKLPTNKENCSQKAIFEQNLDKEEPYEDKKLRKPDSEEQKANHEIISRRMKQLKKAQILLEDPRHNNRVNRSFITPHPPDPTQILSRPVIKLPPKISVGPMMVENNSPGGSMQQMNPIFRPKTEAGSKKAQDSARKVQKPVNSEGQSRSVQKIPYLHQNISNNIIPNEYSYNQRESSNPRVIVSKNYGDHHNEVNVNISIMDGKYGERPKPQVAVMMPVAKNAYHIPSKPIQPIPDRMSNRSFSVKYIAGNRVYGGNSNGSINIISTHSPITAQGSIDTKNTESSQFQYKPTRVLIEKNAQKIGLSRVPEKIIRKREQVKNSKFADRAMSQNPRVKSAIGRYTIYSSNNQQQIVKARLKNQNMIDESMNEYENNGKRIEARRVSGSALYEKAKPKHKPSPRQNIVSVANVNHSKF